MKFTNFFNKLINKLKKQNQKQNRTVPITRENYIEKRLNTQIKWYSSKSRQSQKKFKIFMIFTFVLNATIPVAMLFSDINTFTLKTKIITAFCSSLVTIFSSVIQLNSYQENWLKYRAICESLLREKIFFETKCGNYKNCSDSKDLLIVTCETLMANERNEWLSLNTEKNYSSTNS